MSDDVHRSLLGKRSIQSSYTDPEHKRSKTQRSCTKGLFEVRGRSVFYKLAQNAQAGMTVSLVNVPLSISLAVASGVSPAMGVVTAIWSGLVAAACGGSHFNIVGPTGALSGLLFRYSVIYGVEVMAILSFISAAILAVVYILGLDTYVMFLPNAVNVGFTLGVAFIIGAGQIPNAFGLTGLPVHHELIQNLSESIVHIGNFEWFAATVFLVSWITLYSCAKRWPKVPWSILLSMVGIALGYLSTNGSIHHLNTLNTKYGNLQAVLTLPVVWKEQYSTNIMDLVSASSSVAFVAVLETLISGKIAAGLTQVHMHSRREVFGVTMANLGSALAGGMPATAALARTSLNIRSGAFSRVAGMLNGVFTALLAVILMPTFQYLPLPIVGALVFQVAVGLVDTKELAHYWKLERSTFWLTVIVAVLCVVIDPTTGIVFGCAVGLLMNGEKQSRGANIATIGTARGEQYEDNDRDAQVGGPVPPHESATFDEKLSFTLNSWFCDPEADDSEENRPHPATGSDILTYSFVGSLTFINIGQHVERIRRYLLLRANVSAVILSFENTHFLDVDGILGLQEVVKEIEHAGRRALIVVGEREEVVQLTNKSEWFATLQHQGRVFDSDFAAVQSIRGSTATVAASSNGYHSSNGSAVTVNISNRGTGVPPMYPSIPPEHKA